MKWSEKLKCNLEKFASIILSVVFAVLLIVFQKSFHFIYGGQFLSQVTTISAALFAFLLTILTIIVQSESESMKVIKRHKKYRQFLRFNRRIVLILLGVTLFSLCLTFAQHIFNYLNPHLLFYLSLLNTTLFFLCILDSIYFTILFYVLIMSTSPK